MATRLTPAQKGFLLSLYDPEEDDTYAERYYRHESRTAWALYKRGLVVFADNDEPHPGCETFTAGLTDAGIEAVKKLRWNPLTQ